MTNILSYLDKELENFKIRTGNYPKKIIVNKETREKIFTELELEPTLDNCWFDKKDNYRNIPIEIKKDIFIELEGE